MVVGSWRYVLITECIWQRVLFVKEVRAENGIGCGLNRDTHHVRHHKGPQLEMGKVGEMAKVLIRLGARRPSS